jgi:hypothetical protein
MWHLGVMPVVWSEAMDPGKIWCVLGLFFVSLLLQWLESGAAMNTTVSLNKVANRVGVSPSIVWLFLAQWGFLVVFHVMFKWSASSAATPGFLAVLSLTLIAEGWLRRVYSRCQIFFNLQARVPRRRPCCFIMVFSSPRPKWFRPRRRSG